MSILTELKKLTKKKNATVVSQALPDSLDGSGSGHGGDGANVLTLYSGQKDDTLWAYKNPERTEEYNSQEEAETALANADVVILRDTGNPANKAIPVFTASEVGSVYVSFFASGKTATVVYLYKLPQSV